MIRFMILFVSHRFRRYKNLSKAIFLGFSFVHLTHGRDTYCATTVCVGARPGSNAGPRDTTRSAKHTALLAIIQKNLKYANININAAEGHVITSPSSTSSFRFLSSQNGMSFEATTVDKTYPGSFGSYDGVCSPPFHPPFPFLGNVRDCFYLSFSQRTILVSYSSFAERSK